MTAYIDSSVLLRIVLRASGLLPEWTNIERFIGSAIVRVECFRALHRLRLTEPFSDEQFARHSEIAERTLLRLELISVTDAILERAAGPLSSPLKTLDAIHLATASLWREREEASIFLATHDKQFALAARMMGFPVLGV
ncbi:MAG TPA: type II toxin-antitoxin system VapC family toxin [Thermoanaerobaculia bacterium]|jgi:predicted nucleic acid-binding protein